MLNQNFSPTNLEKLIYNKPDLIRLRLGRDKLERHKNLTAASYKLEETFNLSSIHSTITKGKKVFSPNSGVEVLILRKLNDNIKRVFGIRQSNRNDATKQIYKLLEEANPFTVIRMDVKGFYESIDLREAASKLSMSTVLSPSSKKLIANLIQNPNFDNKLPRGLNISALLSELYMRDFDNKINKLEHIYYYTRFVDDIFLFSHDNSIKLNDIAKLLPKNLTINLEKSYSRTIDCRSKTGPTPKNNPCEHSCKCKPEISKYYQVEYLGYEFNFPDIHTTSGKDKKRVVTVSLSKKKINKIKKRIVLAVLDHFKNPDLKLLESRIRFLTGSCEFTVKGGLTIRSGLAYNFPLLDSNDNSLKDLTSFLRKIIHCKSGTFGAKITSTIPPSNRSRIGKLSFCGGFKNRITYKLSESHINNIKKCWKDE